VSKLQQAIDDIYHFLEAERNFKREHGYRFSPVERDTDDSIRHLSKLTHQLETKMNHLAILESLTGLTVEDLVKQHLGTPAEKEAAEAENLIKLFEHHDRQTPSPAPVNSL
jgi:hypothetical protein